MSERPDGVEEEEFNQLKLLFEEGDDNLSLANFTPLWSKVYPMLSEAKAKKTASTLSARFVYDYMRHTKTNLTSKKGSIVKVGHMFRVFLEMTYARVP